MLDDNVGGKQGNQSDSDASRPLQNLQPRSRRVTNTPIAHFVPIVAAAAIDGTT